MALKRTYSGDESGTGTIYAWSGNRKAGQGRMEITDATEPSKVQIDLVFEKPWKARNDTLFSIKPEGSEPQVTWSVTGKKTRMTKMMGLFQVDGHNDRPGLRQGPRPVDSHYGKVGRN